jgi:hypothetical protein
MDRKTKICLVVIFLGLANFVAYGTVYVVLYGEAVNGRVVIEPDGSRSYYLHSGREVSRTAFLVSGIHSISIWPTVLAILLAMLTLAKDRITSSMHSAVVRGRAIITTIAMVLALVMALLTYEFAATFAEHLRHPEVRQEAPAAPSAPDEGARGG